MRTTFYDYCVEHNKLTLLQQWHPLNNDPLTPHSVTYGSSQKVWWRCERGHEWKTAVYTRTGAETKCPYCAGKRACPGENDLTSQRPDIAAQWHPEKNGTLTPDSVSVGSHRAVWWVCEKGHEWRAMVKTRVAGCGCPVCANRTLLPGVNDLASVRPELACQWHPTKNCGLAPADVLAGTHRKVWWQCGKGHEWQAMVSSRVSGAGCPYCAGKAVLPGENDLASNFPTIAAQWNSEKNDGLKPTDVTPTSNRKVWWRCKLGHEYPAIIAGRTMNGNDCPYCSGKKTLPGFNDLATLQPAVAAQWHPTLNGSLTPQMVTTGSHRMIWWQCPQGHVWKAAIHSRAGPQKCGCPVCAGRVKSERLKRYAALTAERSTGPGTLTKREPLELSAPNIDKR